MNTSRRWMNLMRFSLNVAVSLQTIWIRSERTPFSNGGHSTTRNRSKLAQKGSAKPFIRKAYYRGHLGGLYRGRLDRLDLCGIGGRRLQWPLNAHAADIEQPLRRIVAQVQQV